MRKPSKAERYSSRKQEVCFQPLRVRVLKGSSGRDSYGRQRYYRLIVQNMVTREIVAEYVGGWYHWNKPARWFWSDQRPPDLEMPDEKRGRLRYVEQLDKARNVAKQAAKDRHLPFDLKRDVVLEMETLKGPKQPCLLCGEPDARGWSGTVCDVCKLDAKMGKQQKAESQLCSVDTSGLVHYELTARSLSTLSSRFFCALWALARVVPERPRTSNVKTHGELIKTPRGRPRDANWLVYLSPDQRLAVRDIIELLNTIAKLAHDYGYWKGETILNKIADLSERTLGGRRGGT